MKKYISFDFEVLYFQTEDVITTSGGGGTTTIDPNEGWENDLIGGENDNEW